MTTITDSATQRLEDALEQAHARYQQNNPKSFAQHRKAAQVMPGGNTRTVLFSDPFPLTLASAQSCYVTSLDGQTYVDYLGEFTAGLFGHSDPVIREAIEQALDNGWVRGGHIEQEEILARLICERFPAMESVRFANSGTEANLYAISTARIVTQRDKVMVFEGAYHGGVLTFGAIPSPLVAPFPFVHAPYNDWEATLALLQAHQSELACVLIEPMQGSSGCIAAAPEFLEQLRRWTQANNVILIFDEVMTSRMSGGGLQKMLGIQPDMTTLGKYLCGGFSVGAFGGKTVLMDIFNPLRQGYVPHAGTFNNNVFTMTAGAAGLGQVYTPEVALELSARGEALRARLNHVAATANFPMQFIGVGSLMNVHMTAATIRSIRDLSDSNHLLRDLFYFELLEQGVWPARRGMLNLSLPMGATELDKLVNAVQAFVSRYRTLAH